MKRVILHIGTHKTGSTALQHFLDANRESLISQGVLYPSRHLLWRGHHPFAWSFGVQHPRRDPEVTAEALWRDYRDECEEAGCDTLLLSSEDFSFLRKRPQLEQLADTLRPLEVRVVVYLRRQDLYIESAYFQNLRNYAKRIDYTISDFFMKSDLLSTLDYRALLDAWAECFGRANLLVRTFERDRMGQGLQADFLDCVSIPSTDGLAPVAPDSENRSLAPLAREILRRANRRMLTSEAHEALVERLRAVEPDPDAALVPSVQLTPFQQSAILDRCRGINRYVARHYLGNADGDLFAYSPPPPERAIALSPQEVDSRVAATLTELLLADLSNPSG